MSKKDLAEAAVEFHPHAGLPGGDAGRHARPAQPARRCSRAARVAMLAGMTREELEAAGRRGGGRLAMARRARPSCGCLCEDLGQAVPPADTPLLDEVPSVPNLGGQ